MPVDHSVLRASFAVVERRADQLTKYFYAHLFTHNPGIRALFPERMDEQRDRLFGALTQLVLRLTEPDRLAGYLAALGRDHRKFRVVPGHYPAVGESLIATIRHFSGHYWTPETEKAWTEAYTVISQAMIEAAGELPATTPRWWQAQVVRRHRAAADLVRLTLAPDRPYPFTAGQYLSLCSPRLPQVWRPYSIACAPRADGTIDLHVRRVPGGLLSSLLVNDVMPEESLRIGPPLGDAVLAPGSARPLIAVAGGTGWAQIKSVLEQVALDGGRPTSLYLAARRHGEQYDLESVRRLAALHRWLDVTLTSPPDGSRYEDGVGLLCERLGRHHDCSGHDVHLSGPPGLATRLTDQLIRQGARPELIRADPAPVTFNRVRPVTSSEWFLDLRDVPWINRTEYG
ncbi:globin domain-containing protein [Kitasatospora sp. MBT63]|uniref:globin domain-containing protein n=1 Tax=Kitasatospora sp. MBT63 TaxID=1444768 RepID=UPI000691A973|nr:globin domain-containing protein [Kitasatospora sp. MBT63]